MENGEIVGAVLVGGKSSRMGGHKPEAIVAGSSLRDHALAVLDLVFRQVVLSAATSEPEVTGRQVVIDRQQDCGPLAALEAILTVAAGQRVFALACDLPLVDEHVVHRIVERAAEEERAEKPRAWVAKSNGRVQPLCGLYSASCLEVVRRQLQIDCLSMFELLAAIEVTEVELDDLGSDRLLNVNEPADLERARRVVRAR